MTALRFEETDVLNLSFETVRAPQTFVHVASLQGVLGHVAELNRRVPVGTWLTCTPAQAAVAAWLVSKGGWVLHGLVRAQTADERFDWLLRREG